MTKGSVARLRAIVLSTTPASLPQPMIEAREHIEDVIRTHTAAIVSMKVKLNEQTLIARLPPELLTEIFLHFVAAQSVSCSPLSSHYLYSYSHIAPKLPWTYHWLRITHVCHHWRTVALASPRLWSTIIVSNNASCVREMVQRAKCAPLDVRIGHYANVDGLDAALGGGRFAEVRRLEVPRMEEGGREAVIKSVSTDSAPRMRVLCITSATAAMLRAFEACAMPNLEELEMVSGAVPQWTSPLLVSGLRRLVLSSADVHGVSRLVPQSLAHALEALEEIPLLEYLELRNVLPHLHGEDLSSEARVVSLPKLKALKLVDEALACAQLLRHLSFPAATPLTLDCRADSEDIEPLSATVASKLAGPTATLLTACFFAELERNARLICWTTELEASPGTLLQSTTTAPLLDLRLTQVSETTAFTSLCTLLPLSSLRSLVIHTVTTTILLKNDWVRCFAGMTALRSLSIGRWAEEHFADVLALRIPIDGVNSEPVKKSTGKRRSMQPFLPALHELRLHGVRLRLLPYEYHIQVEEEKDTTLFKLRRALEKRKKSKHAIAKLTIWSSYNVRSADIKSLEGVVGKVVWDGQGGLPPEYGFGEDEDIGDDVSDFYPDVGVGGGVWDDEMDEEEMEWAMAMGPPYFP